MTLREFNYGKTAPVIQQSLGSAGYLEFYVDGTGGSDSNDGLTPATAFLTVGKAWAQVPKRVSSYITINLYNGEFNLASDPLLYGVLGGKTIDGGRITFEGNSFYQWAFKDTGLATKTVNASVDDFSFTVVGGGLTPGAHVGQVLGVNLTGDPMEGNFDDVKLIVKNTADTIWTSEDHYLSGGETIGFFRQNARFTSSVEFDCSMERGGVISLSDIGLGTGFSNYVLALSKGGDYWLDQLQAGDRYEGGMGLVSSPDDGKRIRVKWYDDCAFHQGRSVSSATGVAINASDTDFNTFRQGVFYGRMKFYSCRFTGYGDADLIRFGGAGNSVDDYMVRMVDCSNNPAYLGVWQYCWFDMVGTGGAAIHLQNSQMQISEGVRVDSAGIGIRLDQNSVLLLECRYTPVVAGTCASYGVKCCHGSQVRIYNLSSYTPAIVGGTADCQVEEAGATSSWAAIYGGTPLIGSSEFCYIMKELVSDWLYY